MKNEMYQQGDVLLFSVDASEFSGKAVNPKNGRYILAEGEATGHAHALTAVDGIEMVEAPNGNVYIRLNKEATIKHEEHGPITLPAGTYRVGKVREYDHPAEEARYVAD